MVKKAFVCPKCQNVFSFDINPDDIIIIIECPKCHKTGRIPLKPRFKQVDFYTLNKPFAFAKIIKDTKERELLYNVIEPPLSLEDKKVLRYLWERLAPKLKMKKSEFNEEGLESYLFDKITDTIKNYKLKLDQSSIEKYFYYVKRDSLGYGKIDPLMHDPDLEDISCDGAYSPVFVHHREFGSIRSNVRFKNEDQLSDFVIVLADKCGKQINIANPILDASMPDGSRIQLTLSSEVTTKGSTFTIRKFRADPFTPVDLLRNKTMSAEMLVYFWLLVENNINALYAGSTASGKTTSMNAMSLFIPKESKIISIEETREINLPHPNWIPAVERSGSGESNNWGMFGEIDMYDLMKAALRQNPEYLLVGEIRGKEAYVLFQAMSSGHATYSTIHADSTQSLMHRFEGEPINIPRHMLTDLDVVSLHVIKKMDKGRVRRCKRIVEIVDIDPTTNEILVNEVFHWDQGSDQFFYSGKSYVLDRICKEKDMTHDQMTDEIKRRVKLLEWMNKNDVRYFKKFANIVSHYREYPNETLSKIHVL